MTTKLVISMVLMLHLIPLKAQIVADKDTGIPISNVGIYTEKQGKTIGTYSYENGHFEMNYITDSISFTHINYESVKLHHSKTRDTIFLIPKYQSLAEVIISNHNQSWYKTILKKFIANKKKNYRVSDTPLAYRYQAKSLSDSTLYEFASEGLILIKPLNEENNFMIAPSICKIKATNPNSKSDFTQLSRTIYNEIIQNLDNKFLKESRFALNSEYENEDKNIVMINYQSTKKHQCKGHIIIDTLNNIVKEITQQCDTKYNLPKHTNTIYRTFASKIGMKCLKWETIINIKFERLGNSYQMAECHFQITRVDERKNKDIIKHYFTNMQSLITFSEPHNNNPSWILLPREPYMGILSKKDRLAMKSLQKLPITK